MWIRRITSVTVIALVERQEERVQAREHRGHLDVLVRHRKVHQSPARLKQRTILGRLTVNLVLLDRVPHRLGIVGLQLHGHHGNAVDRQHQIQSVSTCGIERNLAQHPQTVLLRVLNSIRIQRVFRIKSHQRTEGGLHLPALRVREPTPQCAQQTVLDLPRPAIEDRSLIQHLF